MGFPEQKSLVLIIENDPVFAGILAEALTQDELAGTTINQARTMQEGLASIEAKKPDLIFTDLILPDEVAYTLLKQYGEEIPIAVVTTDPRPEVKSYLLKLKARAFFLKGEADIGDMQSFARQQLMEPSSHDSQ